MAKNSTTATRVSSTPIWRLGQMFLVYRQKHNLSLNDVGKQCGVNSGMMCEFQNGNRVGHETMGKIMNWMMTDAAE